MADDAYTPEAVRALLGIEPGICGLDILSWLRDPGGDRVQQMHAAQMETARTAWMARRGPLPPDSELACALYDLEAALSRLRRERRISPAEHAIAALTVFGLSPLEIAEVIDLKGPRTHRELDSRRKRVTRILLGRPKRDREGKVVEDESGEALRVGGLVSHLTREMNGQR